MPNKRLMYLLFCVVGACVSQSSLAMGTSNNDVGLTCLFLNNHRLVHKQPCQANGGGGGGGSGAYGYWDIKSPMSQAFPQHKMQPFVLAGFFGKFDEKDREKEKQANLNQERPESFNLTKLGTPKLHLEHDVSYVLDLTDEMMPVVRDKNGNPLSVEKSQINAMPANLHWRFVGSLKKLTPTQAKLYDKSQLLGADGQPVPVYTCLTPQKNPALEICIDNDFFW